MLVACGIWCLADVSSVSPSSEQTVRTTVSPSSGTVLALCITTPLLAAVPSDLSTQLSGVLPSGILFKSQFLVATPMPHIPTAHR